MKSMLAVIAAFRQEVAGFLKTGSFQETSREGGLRFYTSESLPNVVVSEGGFARESARESVREVVRRFSPTLIVSAGFAGGAKPGQRAGRVVVCDRVIALEGPAYTWKRGIEREMELSTPLLAGLREKMSLDDRYRPARGYEIGSCVTVPQFIANSSMKEWLGSAFDASTIDMESYWIAEAAGEMRAPFLAVRAVLDTVDQDVSPIVGRALEQGVAGSSLRSVRHLVSSPFDVFGLLALWRQVKTARKSLGDFLFRFALSSPAEAGA